MSYWGNTVFPDIEATLDHAAEVLTGNEVVTNESDYNVGYYNGAYRMFQQMMELWFGPGRIEIGIENGNHVIHYVSKYKNEAGS